MIKHYTVALNSKTDQPLELYIDEFETPYIAQTKAYYKMESNIKLSSCTISQYMRSAIDRLAQEVSRNSRYCHPTSHARVCTEFYYWMMLFLCMTIRDLTSRLYSLSS